MEFAQNDDVRLWYERLGRDGDPVVLLLNGAGKQGTDSPDALCARLIERGYSVIRFDQRDTDAVGVAAAVAERRSPKLAYTADDLAADALAVLDAAGVERAHLLGRSLGTYVAQLVALGHPHRVLSLTLVMAFSRAIGGSTPPARLAMLDAENFTDADAFVARQVATAQALGNPAYFDEARIRREAGLAFSRGVHRGAIGRHFAVGLAASDIRDRLAAFEMPVGVIHGALDKVIPLALAQETAAAIPNAQLTVLDDMAHEGPPELWDRWIDLFAANAKRAA